MTPARAARHRRTVARVACRPRRRERLDALLVELRHALRGKSAEVEGYRAALVDVAPGVGHVELTFSVDLGDVTLGMGLDEARAVLAQPDPAAALFGMVADVVRAEEREGLPS